jgi:hypothetical protein
MIHVVYVYTYTYMYICIYINDFDFIQKSKIVLQNNITYVFYQNTKFTTLWRLYRISLLGLINSYPTISVTMDKSLDLYFIFLIIKS